MPGLHESEPGIHDMNDKSPELLVVQLNGSAILEYDRNQQLSKAQRRALTLMDEKLDQGISLGDEFIPQPGLEQRVEFIAANLVSALLNAEDVLAAASCAYLAKALPELKQIKALEKSGQVAIELIFNREYQKEVKMQYKPLSEIATSLH